MSFQDQVLDDLAVFFSDFAQGIQYNLATDVPAIVNFSAFPEFESGNVYDHAEITVKQSDVPEPKQGDMVKIGGGYWQVERAMSGYDGLVWKISVRKSESVRFRS